MKQISWQRFVAALIALDCQVTRDGEFTVSLVYKATLLVRVRKISPVAVASQRRILDELQIDVGDYVAALAGADPPDEAP